MKTKVLLKLKPKAASLGFNEKELEGVTDKLVGNLADDATDEIIDAEIDKILPYLQVSQTFATRVINAAKPKTTTEPKTIEEGAVVIPKTDNEPSWFKTYREEQEAKFAVLNQASIAEQRAKLFTADLEGLLPKQKEAALKDFGRMTFADNDDFDAYRLEKQAGVAEIAQELANNGLAAISKPGSGDSEKTEENEFVKMLSDINTQTTL